MEKKASKFNLLKKGLKSSLSNLWRNKFLSLATIFVIGTTIFIFNVILAVNFIARDSLEDLSKKIDIVVYLKESTTYEDTQKLIKKVEKIEGVEAISYTSKDQALEQFKITHPDITIAFEKYDLENPLPANLNITTTHPKYHKQVAELLLQDKNQIYLSNIVTGDNSSNAIITSVSKNLLEVTNFAQQLIFWLILTFIIGGTLIILNALQITIFNRKQEITVMKLVGAPHWFIRLPFIIESIIYGVLAVVISFLMALILSKNIQISETSLWNYYTEIPFHRIFLIEIGITVTLSIASSMLAVHEYLQEKIIDN